MAAKTSWRRYGTKLRHCHRLYNYSFAAVVKISSDSASRGSSAVAELLVSRTCSQTFASDCSVCLWCENAIEVQFIEIRPERAARQRTANSGVFNQRRRLVATNGEHSQHGTDRINRDSRALSISLRLSVKTPRNIRACSLLHVN